MPGITNRHPVTGSSPDGVGELRFMVTLGGGSSGIIGRFSECTGLQVEYEVLEHQEGGLNDYVHKFRGRAKFPNIVLKRGITKENALMKWFRDCSTKVSRQELKISLLGPAGKSMIVREWAFQNAFPVKWTGPNLNAGSTSLAMETLEIAHEGFSPAMKG